MSWKFLKTLSKAKDFHVRRDCDPSLRLLTHYSAFLFLACCILVTTFQYLSKPIHCWCEAQFKGSHVKYTNAYCLVSTTYYVKFEGDLPHDPNEAEALVSYYVWVPFIFLIHAILCVIPSALWKSVYTGVGFNVASLIKRLEDAQSTGLDSEEDTIKSVVKYLFRYSCGLSRESCVKAWVWNIRKSKDNLTMSYLFLSSDHYPHTVSYDRCLPGHEFLKNWC